MAMVLQVNDGRSSGMPPAGSQAGGRTCIENIGPRGRSTRLRFGVVMLVITLGLTAVLALSGLSRWWRLALFLPYAASASGFLQAFRRT